jgi:hypothetical protein
VALLSVLFVAFPIQLYFCLTEWSYDSGISHVELGGTVTPGTMAYPWIRTFHTSNASPPCVLSPRIMAKRRTGRQMRFVLVKSHDSWLLSGTTSIVVFDWNEKNTDTGTADRHRHIRMRNRNDNKGMPYHTDLDLLAQVGSAPQETSHNVFSAPCILVQMLST